MNLNFERQKATFAACCDDSMARLKAPFSRNVFIGLIFCVLFLFVMYYYLVERRRHAEKLLDYFDAATSTENFTTHPSADVAPFIFIGGIPRSGTTLISMFTIKFYHIQMKPVTKFSEHIFGIFKHEGYRQIKLNMREIFKKTSYTTAKIIICDLFNILYHRPANT